MAGVSSAYSRRSPSLSPRSSSPGRALLGSGSASSAWRSRSATHTGAGHAEFRAVLDKTDGARLGIHFREEDMEIVLVQASGLVESWNGAHPSQKFEPGDHIVEVNGQQDNFIMDLEMRKNQLLHVRVRKSGFGRASRAAPASVLSRGEGFSSHVHAMTTPSTTKSAKTESFSHVNGLLHSMPPSLSAAAAVIPPPSAKVDTLSRMRSASPRPALSLSASAPAFPSILASASKCQDLYPTRPPPPPVSSTECLSSSVIRNGGCDEMSRRLELMEARVAANWQEFSLYRMDVQVKLEDLQACWRRPLADAVPDSGRIAELERRLSECENRLASTEMQSQSRPRSPESLASTRKLGRGRLARGEKSARGRELSEDRFHSILGEAAEALEAVAQMAESFDQTRAHVDAQLLEFRAETAGTVGQVQAMLSAASAKLGEALPAAQSGHVAELRQGAERQNGGRSVDAGAVTGQAVKATREPHRSEKDGSRGDAARVRRSRRAKPTPLENPAEADGTGGAYSSDRSTGSSGLQNSHEPGVHAPQEGC